MQDNIRLLYFMFQKAGKYVLLMVAKYFTRFSVVKPKETNLLKTSNEISKNIYFKLCHGLLAYPQYLIVETDVSLTINDPNFIGKNVTVSIYEVIHFFS